MIEPAKYMFSSLFYILGQPFLDHRLFSPLLSFTPIQHNGLLWNTYMSVTSVTIGLDKGSSFNWHWAVT